MCRGIVNRKHKTWKICFSYNLFNLLSRKQLQVDGHFEDFIKAYFSKMLFYYAYDREGGKHLAVFEAFSIQNNSRVVGKAIDE